MSNFPIYRSDDRNTLLQTWHARWAALQGSETVSLSHARPWIPLVGHAIALPFDGGSTLHALRGVAWRYHTCMALAAALQDCRHVDRAWRKRRREDARGALALAHDAAAALGTRDIRHGLGDLTDVTADDWHILAAFDESLAGLGLPDLLQRGAAEGLLPHATYLSVRADLAAL